MTSELLTPVTVLPYLRSRHVLDDSAAEAHLLGGGVSNVVIAVSQGESQLVVKQSLPKLRVEAEWLAPVERVITEGKAIGLARRVLGTGPTMRDSDDTAFTITMQRADDDWVDWKTRLFTSPAEPAIAAEVGRQIALIHDSTRDPARLDPDFLRTEPFDVLRVDPYYRATAARAPAQASHILTLADDLVSRRVCLVHGDLSPKNILVGSEASDTWMIDWEVAHFGDPVFDLAFMVTHLTMKSIHLPAYRASLDASTDAFVGAYDARSESPSVDWGRVLSHVGCLLMARVLGKSPAEYLHGSSSRAVLDLGRALVDEGAHDFNELRTLRERTTA
jgi:aminoglycoside phosphotransferase (APT) family kinase protein